MHSLAPIAGITSPSGSISTPKRCGVEARERRPELLAAAVGGVLVGARVGDRRLHRLDDVLEGRAVGVADAEADHVDAGRPLVGDLPLELGEHVGGIASRRCEGSVRAMASGGSAERLALCDGPAHAARAPEPARGQRSSSARPTRRELAGVDGRGRAGQGHVEVAADLDGQLAAVELDRDRALAPREDARATAAPAAPVPDESVSPTPRSKIRARTVEPSAAENETLVRLGNSCVLPSISGPIVAEVELLDGRRRPRSRTAGCRSRRAGSPTRARRLDRAACRRRARTGSRRSGRRPGRSPSTRVPGPVIVGVTSPAAVTIANVVRLGPARARAGRATASRAPLPESSASDPSGLKIRSSAT